MRLRDFLVANVLRPLTLAAWCLVLWGTLLLVLVAWKAATAGLAAARESLLPAEDASVWAWLNLGCAIVALVVWAVAAVVAWLNRRP